MADVVSKEKRSQMMSGIKGSNTKPELLVRKGLYALGYRYRLHDKRLAGKPDIVLRKYKAVIFVHGCFWHGHDCHLFKWPKTRQDWWRTKILRNKEKDEENTRQLREAGWRVLEIWECALKGKERYPLQDVIQIAHDWLPSEGNALIVRGKE